MAKGESQSLIDSRPMVGGDGANSYANNSSYQGGAVNAAKDLINDGIIEKLDLKILGLDDGATTNTFRVADYGCSTGPNTFIAVQNIIDAVEMKLLQSPSSAGGGTVEFQVFFNDHTDNDFNILFKSLPPSRKYFAAGVPGSFYSRLFPKSSVHFVHSSYTLHWLSKVPKVDGLEGSTIQTRRFVKEVMEAYDAQYKIDMNSFLNSRAQELVPGGLAVLVIFAVPDGVPLADNAPGSFYHLFGSCLVDMAKMGILDEEKVKSFDVPMHNPTPKELGSVIEENGSFSIERMERMSNPKQQIFRSAKGFALMMRAVFEGLVKEHFGEEFVDQIFDLFTAKVEERVPLIMEKAKNQMIDLFVLLKRKV